jgi:hypothetical protein
VRFHRRWNTCSWVRFFRSSGLLCLIFYVIFEKMS